MSPAHLFCVADEIAATWTFRELRLRPRFRPACKQFKMSEEEGTRGSKHLTVANILNFLQILVHRLFVEGFLAFNTVVLKLLPPSSLGIGIFAFQHQNIKVQLVWCSVYKSPLRENMRKDWDHDRETCTEVHCTGKPRPPWPVWEYCHYSDSFSNLRRNLGIRGLGGGGRHKLSFTAMDSKCLDEWSDFICFKSTTGLHSPLFLGTRKKVE